jgi:hypothetical protein
MERSPSWGADSCAASCKIPNILRNPKVCYGFHKSPLFIFVSSQTNPTHAFLSYTFHIHLNVILYLCYGTPLWSSGQSSRLQILRSESESRHYQIFWEAMSLERGPLSLVSTAEELLGRKSNSSGLGNRDYSRGDPSRWPRDTFCLQRLALSSPTSGGRSIFIARSRT